jgi:S-DNA-T family DNA segregation ATPase FtsK/SpoIIIE
MTASSKRKRRTTRKRKNTKDKQQANFLKREVLLLTLLAFSILLLISNFGFGGAFGATLTSFIFGIFGFTAYLFPIILFMLAAFIVVNKENKAALIKSTAGIVLFLCLSTFIEFLNKSFDKSRTLLDYYTYSAEQKGGGGIVSGVFSKLLCPTFGVLGAYVILSILMIICIVLITERSFLNGVRKGSSKVFTSAKMDVKRRKERADAKRSEGLTQRVDKKVKGVAFDTELPKEELQNEELHEITPSPSARKKRKKKEERREEKQEEKKTDILEAPEESFKMDFTIHRAEPITDVKDSVQDILPEETFSKADIISDTYDFSPENASPVIEGTDLLQKEVKTSDSDKVIDQENEKKSDKSRQSVKNPKSSEQEIKGNIQDIGKEIELHKAEKKEYIFPPLNLLQKSVVNKNGDSDKLLHETARKLQQTLHNFGVKVSVTNISCGPAVTRYELQPEQGVKVSRIVNLADDIKLNLATADIRIEAPIPGKAAVGIEVPNKENSAVMFRELIETEEFRKHPSNLAFAAGKDIAGKVVVTDIAKMPHLLIAGATGSGKSVCINTLIMSIIYKANPEDVKLIMIDPKVVELSVYNGIPHLFIPVVTDPKKAAGALNWAVAEMTDRYQKFAEYNVRDLKGYNQKIALVQDIDDGEEKPEKLPQIVIIVDELADLMMVAPGEVEDAICRLAQLARAAGIHLIIATQRPSVNVITGLIKANMPSRIAFSVSSGVDSRTIIDMNGAEKLLGKGDMLFYPQGYQKPARVQGAFVSDKEVSDVVEFLTEQNAEVTYNTEIEEKMKSLPQVPGDSSGSDRDVYFVDAGKFIIEKDKASIGMLQRFFKIGFNRAARIMDQLSDAGVVGEEEGTKPRKVLMSMEEFEMYIDEYV